MIRKTFLTLTAAMLTLAAQAQAPAFPGAEGHGRYTDGGRGGKVVHVTNLNDSGTGSLRNAVSGSEKKIVVFDVGGVIALTKDLTIGANTTILGQTAPAPGITLRYYTIQPSSNCVIRFIRSRRGEEKDVNDGADAIWNRNLTGVMIDHCSFSWSIDEVASFYDNNNFTLQWSTIAESLVHPGHSKGAHGYGGIWGGKLASFHHNLIAHVANRAPRFNGARYNWTGYTSNKLYAQYKWKNAVQAENVDFRNCVIFNCGNGCYGGPGGGQINMVNNYYKSGQIATSVVTQVTYATKDNSGSGSPYYDMSSRYYISGNRMNNTSNYDWTGVKYDNQVPVSGSVRYTYDTGHYYDAASYTKINSKDALPLKLTEPAPTGDVTTHTADKAYDKVLDYAGASLNRDEVDARYASETRAGKATYKGSATSYVEDGTTKTCTPQWGRIDKVSDVNGYNETNFGTGSRDANFDTDRDGIPDAWETANGLNPNDASDAMKTTLDPIGYYSNIEVYANSLVQEIMIAGNADATDAVSDYYPAYTKEDGTAVAAVNIPNGESPEEGGTCSVMFNGSDAANPAGFFDFGTSSNKHNFNNKFQGTYDGISYTQGLKMEGSTIINFTTKSAATVTIVQSTWSTHTIKLDGTELDVASATTPAGSTGVRVYTVDIGAGDHQIARGSGESGLFYVEVSVTGTTGIKTVGNGYAVANDGNIYNLGGQKVGEGYRSIVIKNGRKIIQK